MTELSSPSAVMQDFTLYVMPSASEAYIQLCLASQARLHREYLLTLFSSSAARPEQAPRSFYVKSFELISTRISPELETESSADSRQRYLVTALPFRRSATGASLNSIKLKASGSEAEAH